MRLVDRRGNPLDRSALRLLLLSHLLWLLLGLLRLLHLWRSGR